MGQLAARRKDAAEPSNTSLRCETLILCTAQWALRKTCNTAHPRAFRTAQYGESVLTKRYASGKRIPDTGKKPGHSTRSVKPQPTRANRGKRQRDEMGNIPVLSGSGEVKVDADIIKRGKEIIDTQAKDIAQLKLEVSKLRTDVDALQRREFLTLGPAATPPPSPPAQQKPKVAVVVADNERYSELVAFAVQIFSQMFPAAQFALFSHLDPRPKDTKLFLYLVIMPVPRTKVPQELLSHADKGTRHSLLILRTNVIA